MLDQPLSLRAPLDAANMHSIEIGGIEHVEAGAESVAGDDVNRHAVEGVLQRHGAVGLGAQSNVGAQLLDRRVQHRRERGDGALGEEGVEDLAARAVLRGVGDAYRGRGEAERVVEVRVFVESGVLLVDSDDGVY